MGGLASREDDVEERRESEKRKGYQGEREREQLRRDAVENERTKRDRNRTSDTRQAWRGKNKRARRREKRENSLGCHVHRWADTHRTVRREGIRASSGWCSSGVSPPFSLSLTLILSYRLVFSRLVSTPLLRERKASPSLPVRAARFVSFFVSKDKPMVRSRRSRRPTAYTRTRQLLGTTRHFVSAPLSHILLLSHSLPIYLSIFWLCLAIFQGMQSRTRGGDFRTATNYVYRKSAFSQVSMYICIAGRSCTRMCNIEFISYFLCDIHWLTDSKLNINCQKR